jgi:hypothetical protein
VFAAASFAMLLMSNPSAEIEGTKTKVQTPAQNRGFNIAMSSIFRYYYVIKSLF